MTFVEDLEKRMAMKPIIFVLLILCLYLQNGVSVKINHKRQKYLTNSEFFQMEELNDDKHMVSQRGEGDPKTVATPPAVPEATLLTVPEAKAVTGSTGATGATSPTKGASGITSLGKVTSASGGTGASGVTGAAKPKGNSGAINRKEVEDSAVNSTINSLENTIEKETDSTIEQQTRKLQVAASRISL